MRETPDACDEAAEIADMGLTASCLGRRLLPLLGLLWVDETATPLSTSFSLPADRSR